MQAHSAWRTFCRLCPADGTSVDYIFNLWLTSGGGLVVAITCVLRVTWPVLGGGGWMAGQFPVPPASPPLGFSGSRVASNDSDSDLDEASGLLSPAGGATLHRLSFLEKQGSEAGTEGSRGSCSGSEERLEAVAGLGGDGDGDGAGEGEDLAQPLSEYNTNQNNSVAGAWLPAMRLRRGRWAAVGAGQDRWLVFV